MNITERRIVIQDWYESEDSKTGWESIGIVFQDDLQAIESDWLVSDWIYEDKYGNPIIGIEEKQTNI